MAKTCWIRKGKNYMTKSDLEFNDLEFSMFTRLTAEEVQFKIRGLSIVASLQEVGEGFHDKKYAFYQKYLVPGWVCYLLKNKKLEWTVDCSPTPWNPDKVSRLFDNIELPTNRVRMQNELENLVGRFVDKQTRQRSFWEGVTTIETAFVSKNGEYTFRVAHELPKSFYLE